ncbi:MULTISPECIES: response regulator [unclassified Siphonobacter]|uniref:response regulator n=1 Tax=unclassified Siphonobacter TaxID=2635712 RepID=UPI000CB32A7A|nr:MULTISPECIES: response regulator [unclassified Siphonobacter]MDQ1087949.1 CheY-like chemotaxis protein [Siphonobacter sp. SORGH_AS_1065]MDR6194095.1 CheY-like chemotaxis protein [Siphonobacter sp. SORGH_AS_0500]PKK36908.1 response regulator rcp1 [Siphonobacter sp. SORGH_AS_0500]
MKQRVFLADDDEDDRFFATQGINPDADCELTLFTNGEDLIHHLEKLPTSEQPTLIFLDLNMPRMNGFETLAILKEKWKHIPAIILTTSDHERDREKAARLGADDFLTKPDNFNRLNEVLTSISSCWKA